MLIRRGSVSARNSDESDSAGVATFTGIGDLVAAHLDGNASKYREVRRQFEEGHGHIIDEYMPRGPGLGATGAVVVHENDSKVRGRTYRIMLSYDSCAAPPPVDHVVSAVRGAERRWTSILVGHSQEVVIRALYTVLVSVLNTVDCSRPSHPTMCTHSEERVRVAVETAHAELDGIKALARSFAKRVTLQAYLVGMPFGVLLVAALVMLLGTIRPGSGILDNNVGAQVASVAVSGAIGAIISVMVRVMNGDRLSVNQYQGRVFAAVVGAFRPLIGAVMAAALYVLVTGGVFPVAPPQLSQVLDPEKTLYFAGLGFLAGFSERWAQDTIVRSLPRLTPTARVAVDDHPIEDAQHATHPGPPPWKDHGEPGHGGQHAGRKPAWATYSGQPQVNGAGAAAPDEGG